MVRQHPFTPSIIQPTLCHSAMQYINLLVKNCLCLVLFCRLRAAQDPDRAMVLFQDLLSNLDIQHSRFVQEESFLLQHNIRRYKQNFQVCVDGICGKIKHLRICIFVFNWKHHEFEDNNGSDQLSQY